MSNLLSRGYSRVGTPIRQAAGFAGSSIMNSLIGAVLAALLARNLSTDQFGTYSFASQFIIFVAMFCEFGLFIPAARRAAVADVADRPKILGAALIAYLPVGLVCSVAIFSLSYTVQPIFHVAAGHALRLVAPLAFVYPFPVVALQLVQGVDRLHIYSMSSVLGRILFLAVTVVLVGDHHRLDVPLVVLVEASSLLVGSAVLVGLMRPTVHAAHGLVVALGRDAREYGLQIYFGRILSIGTYNMDVLMVAAFANARTTGYYVLAGSIAATVGLPAGSLAAALFGRMVGQARLDRGALRAAIAFSILGTAGAVALAVPFVYWVIGVRYRPVIPLVAILAPAAGIRGITSLYNNFLSAHGRGQDLRNAALVLTVANLAANFALIPSFGAAGAAWASLIALIANLFAHLRWYRRFLPADQTLTVHKRVTAS